jgi:hypothetical protein
VQIDQLPLMLSAMAGLHSSFESPAHMFNMHLLLPWRSGIYVKLSDQGMLDVVLQSVPCAAQPSSLA